MLLERFSKYAGLPLSQIERYAASASRRYKVYQIPKRTSGLRTIEQPSSEIKAIQRWLIGAVIDRFPTHAAATAYAKGSSVKKNATLHRSNPFTLRLDYRSFFPSFTGDHVDRFFSDKAKERDLIFDEKDLWFFRQIVLRNGALTIGAPSSPSLTNVMMYDLDAKMATWCKEQALIYTRYADDIFISARQPNQLKRALDYTRQQSTAYRYGDLKINDEKTAFLSRRYRRSVTGLIITPEGNISIGLSRKTLIKTMIYKYKIGKLNPEEHTKLQGLVAFASDSEPTFFATLNRKYGKAVLDEIRTGTFKDGVVTALRA